MTDVTLFVVFFTFCRVKAIYLPFVYRRSLIIFSRVLEVKSHMLLERKHSDIETVAVTARLVY